MLSDIDSFSYDQCVALLSKLTQIFKVKKPVEVEISPIDRFFGTVSDEDSEKMLSAVQDCRRIEPNEW